MTCARLQHNQSKALSLLLSSVGAESLKLLLPNLLNITAPAFASSSFEPQRCALAAAVLSLHGDAKRAMSAMLSVNSLDAPFLHSLCRSSASSKVVCSMLSGPALDQQHNDVLVGKLLAHTAALACTATGYHVIHSCFGAAFIDYREKLVAFLAGDIGAVRRSFFGSLLLASFTKFCAFAKSLAAFRCKLDEFIADAASWRVRIAANHRQRQMFDDVTGTSASLSNRKSDATNPSFGSKDPNSNSQNVRNKGKDDIDEFFDAAWCDAQPQGIARSNREASGHSSDHVPISITVILALPLFSARSEEVHK